MIYLQDLMIRIRKQKNLIVSSNEFENETKEELIMYGLVINEIFKNSLMGLLEKDNMVNIIS